jgi:TDG/mug DNA glycosylase family protein
MPIVEDVIKPNLPLLICGSALGNVSAQKKAYYAHPQNRFWKTLYEVGLTPHIIAPQNYGTLLKYGIGLTDLCKEESGLDSQLSKQAYDVPRLANLIEQYTPGMLVFSALAPARAFMRGHFGVAKQRVSTGLQPQSLTHTKIFICTSTSPLYPNQKRTLTLWREVARLIRA